MQKHKLHQIIADKNERLEDHAVRQAAAIIDDIVSEQQRIVDSTGRIKELRAELNALEIKEIDSAAVLGEA